MRASSLVLVFIIFSTAAAADDLTTRPATTDATSTKCASLLPQFESPVVAPQLDKLMVLKAEPWRFRDAYKRSVSCTGYSCGCYDAEAVCMANCPPQGQPGHLDCISDCGRVSRRCAICCCCTPMCPEYCGG